MCMSFDLEIGDECNCKARQFTIFSFVRFSMHVFLYLKREALQKVLKNYLTKQNVPKLIILCLFYLFNNY